MERAGGALYPALRFLSLVQMSEMTAPPDAARTAGSLELPVLAVLCEGGSGSGTGVGALRGRWFQGNNNVY